MKPENKAHGQFTYFQAIIEDEYLLLDFNDKCSLHLSVTEDTLVQIYKKLDDLVLEEWEVGGYFMMEQQIEFTSNNELMLNFDHNYIFLKFSSKIEMKEFFAYFKKEIESSLELDKQAILKEVVEDFIGIVEMPDYEEFENIGKLKKEITEHFDKFFKDPEFDSLISKAND